MSGAPPEWTLPQRPYLPGHTERPPEALFARLKRDVAPGMSAADLARSRAFEGGLEAFSAGYYWEAHELWEAVWMCLPPASAERHLLRGLIQLANAGLKARMGRFAAAERIRGLARAALDEAFLHGAPTLMRLTSGQVQTFAAQVKAEKVAI